MSYFLSGVSIGSVKTPDPLDFFLATARFGNIVVRLHAHERIHLYSESFTPKAFSMRNAISPDKSALPFKRWKAQGGIHAEQIAAALTDRPAASTISVRMNSPGCGGFFMGIGGCSVSSVASGGSLPGQFTDLPLVIDPERQAAIARDAQTPCAFPASAQRWAFQAASVRNSSVSCMAPEGQHLPQLVRAVRRHAF
ncbi:MAG TPA: hypothetical protein VG345_02675 [Bryobacteraceae bacterium]|nr:hypothetical protein [Bryobacteraceae bacterium]